jgi:hypothetical protein
MAPWTNFCKFSEFKNRSASPVEEVIAFITHARVPDIRIGFPCMTGKLVRVSLGIHGKIMNECHSRYYSDSVIREATKGTKIYPRG